MTYLVMECFKSYSVVLDSEGRFLKVANLNYEVGQTLDRVYEIEEQVKEEKQEKTIYWKKHIGLLTIAAAFLLIFSNFYNLSNQMIGSVFMKINPEVRMDINRKENVINIEGLNPDGIDLINGYEYENKNIDLVIDELIEIAINKGYLYDQGKINIKLDGEDSTWVDKKKVEIDNHLNTHLKENISIEIKLSTNYSDYDSDYSEYDDSNYNSQQIIIPIPDNESNYDDNQTDYDNSQTDYIHDQNDYGYNNYNTNTSSDTSYEVDNSDYDTNYETNYESDYDESDYDD